MDCSLLFVAVSVICTYSLQAQDVRETPPPYRGPSTQVPGVFVTPVPGAPFLATVVIESEHPLPDGSIEKMHSSSHIARDSSGRIFNERRDLVESAFKGIPPLISARIFDPATHTSETCNAAAMICYERRLPPAPPRSGARDGEDLGVRSIAGLEVKGTRVTRTIPARFSGTGHPVEVTDETWYSEDLHMNLLQRHTDPRSGAQTVTLVGIGRVEPDAATFNVPAGYKIVDATPPAHASADQANP